MRERNGEDEIGGGRMRFMEDPNIAFIFLPSISFFILYLFSFFFFFFLGETAFDLPKRLANERSPCQQGG